MFFFFLTDEGLLWDFLLQLLNDPCQRYSSYIAWNNRDSGIFIIIDPGRLKPKDNMFFLLKMLSIFSVGLAKLWGMQMNQPTMDYGKMSRALTYYTSVNVLKKIQGPKPNKGCYQ